jgi:hypothetical protein
MKDWQTPLRDGDPGAHAFLHADEVSAMRRAVLAAVPPTVRAPRLWIQPLLVAATIALMIGTGAVAGHRAGSQAPERATAAVPEDTRAETRQLQFATPGGTRIIWTFNSEFDLP